MASCLGRLISRCLCFGSSFSCLCNHLWFYKPRFLSFFQWNFSPHSSQQSFPNGWLVQSSQLYQLGQKNVMQNFLPDIQSMMLWKCCRINLSSISPIVGDTNKRLMSSPKCRSVEVINNPARPGSNHREVNCINYK